ncbi:DNA-processing protein DprA [Streptomyces sp. NPDC051776]|uniref:DNA-processing protein DprA n=1 Tax=Streptomyces sp. NPDC051776 TaxID=3155414 RepID=UPI00341D90E3
MSAGGVTEAAPPGTGPAPGLSSAPASEPGSGPRPAACTDQERLARAALSRIAEPGDEVIGAWLRAIGPVGLMRLLTSAEEPQPPEVAGKTVSAERMAGYRIRATGLDPAADLAAVSAVGGRFVCPGDGEWPRQLDDLGHARPVGLWVRGLPSLRKWALRSVAVVGARACTDYGAHVAASLGAGLAESGWVVVSGAAYGVDGAAHRGALAADGATMGVLACGVDVAYPRGHTELIARIAERGMVMAELPPGGHPTRSRFVLRNRVIAALTRGTVVVEAQYRSGSLVTARRAQKLGRVVMGVPGPVTSGLSAGVHELLRGEAALVTDAAEVNELIGRIGDLAPERHGPVVARDLLDPLSARMLDALPRRASRDARRLARDAGTGYDEALAKLYELQSLGFVERHGERWQLALKSPDSGGVPRGGP